jgi:hypothetical protein
MAIMALREEFAKAGQPRKARTDVTDLLRDGSHTPQKNLSYSALEVQAFAPVTSTWLFHIVGVTWPMLCKPGNGGAN